MNTTSPIKFYLIPLFVIFWINASAQIESFVNPIEFSNPSSLQPLKESIGSARVVMIGEQDHGDGKSLTEKIKLIKYLHQEMGFEIVAFESGFFDLNTMWNRYLQNEVSIDSVKRNIYRIWRTTDQIQPLFTYIDESQRSQKPLQITGIDCRHFHKYSHENYVSDFINMMESINLNIEEYKEFIAILTELIAKEYNHKPTQSEKNLFRNKNKEIQKVMEGMNNFDNHLIFWKQELKSLAAMAENAWNPITNKATVNNIRDKQMAENLLWLANTKYADKKIVVWAANLHIIKNTKEIKKSKYFDSDKFIAMGDHVFSQLKDDVYILGFTSLQGKYADMEFNAQRPIKYKKGSFESLISKSNYEIAFLNFKNPELIQNSYFQKPYPLKGIYHREQIGKWHQVFDGLFYIKNMTPSTYIK